MQLSAQVNDAPDNDSFLPRQLTVQLLAILARALPRVQGAAQSTKFVENFRNKSLFTPLTYAIFWREDTITAIDKFPDALDTIDKYNRAPLLNALANEDFVTAKKLLDQGAKIFLEDKLILEITLFSIIQRDPQAAGKILAAATAAEKSWISEYLDYLHSYAVSEPSKTSPRDLIDPPLRHFGQILETQAYFNGMPSYYGFLSPALQILREHLTQYNATDLFALIAKAFAVSIDTGKYHGNLPQNAAAAEELHKKIQDNIVQPHNEPAVLFGGWAGNAVALAFINKTLILSNLGTASDLVHGTNIYEIKNPMAITPEFIRQFIQGLGYAADPGIILKSIGEIVDPTPIFQIKQELKPIDNCIFVNPRLIIEGLLLVLSAYKAHNTATAKNLPPLLNNVSIMYQEYLDSLYKVTTAELAQFMRNNELLPNQRLEGCDLALEYINQHFQEPAAVARCIELKDALEFVGLKDYYQRQISSGAQKAIQNQMISEQENAAVTVIDQEYELFGKRVNAPAESLETNKPPSPQKTEDSQSTES